MPRITPRIASVRPVVLRAPSLAILVVLALSLLVGGCADRGALVQTAAPANVTLFKDLDFKRRAPDAFDPAPVERLDGVSVIGYFNQRSRKHRPQTTLSLAGLPAGKRVVLRFDLYFIGNWESAGSLRDTFRAWVDGGPTLLEQTEFPCALRERNVETSAIDNDGWATAKGRTLGYWVQSTELVIPATAVQNGRADVVFRGNLSGKGTEFWGLAKMKVFVEA